MRQHFALDYVAGSARSDEVRRLELARFREPPACRVMIDFKAERARPLASRPLFVDTPRCATTVCTGIARLV